MDDSDDRGRRTDTPAAATVVVGKQALAGVGVHFHATATDSSRAADLPLVAREHYTILDEFARGGLGRITRARDLRSGRIVAIKEMLGVDRDDAAQRFVREALITANLQHPAIVPVYELGRWPSGEPFYAMKLVTGRSFEDVIAAERTLAGRLARLPVVIAVADALAYAHQSRIIHRDLKPANVLVGDFGETVVIDWGLAKAVGSAEPAGRESMPRAAAEGHTVAGVVMGTPAYMSPEQARGELADERSDVYAIGAMLYQLISGHAPFVDESKSRAGKPTPTLVIAAVAGGDKPTALATLQPDAPADLVTIIDKAMAPDRDARYATAGELADDLQRFTAGNLVRAHHYDRRSLLARWVRRNRAAVTVAGVLVAVLVVLGALSVARIITERDRARDASTEAERARVLAVDEAARTHDALATALFQKGRAAEAEHQWARAAMFYAASRVQHDTREARWAAGLAEANAMAPRAIVDHRAPVRAVAISPDGSRVASVDAAGAVVVWSPSDGARLAGAQISKRALFAVAWAPSGRELAVGGDDGVIVRLTPELARAGELRGHVGRVWSIAYSPDGAILASAGEDTTARLVTLATGAVRELRGHTQRIYDLAFAPDGARVVTASDDRRALSWDIANPAAAPEQVATHVAGGIVVAAFTPSGDLVTAGWDREIHLRHAGRGAIGPAIDVWADDHDVHGAAISPDGSTLVTGGDFDRIHVWSLASHDLITSLPVRGPITAAAFSRDGRVLVTAADTGIAIAWDARPLARLAHTIGHAGGVASLAFTADGRLVSGGSDQTLRTWDVHTGAELRRITTTERCGDSIVPLGDDLISPCADGVLRRWDASGAEIARLHTDLWLRYAAATSDGKTIVAGHLHGIVYAIDVERWAVERQTTAHSHQLYDLVPRGDGRLVTSGLDDHARVWRGPDASGALVVERDIKLGTDDGVLTADLSPDATQLAAGTQDGHVVVYDLAHDRWLVHDGGVTRMTELGILRRLRYAPDGRHAYTAGDDGLRIWDTTTWRDSVLLDAGGGAAHNLAVSPDGALLAGGYASGGIVLWDLAHDRLARRIGGSAQHGTCADVDATTWVDAAQRTVVADACAADAADYLAGLAGRTHQRVAHDVDLAWDWE